MRWRSFATLRARLGLLFLIALVPATLLQVGVFVADRRQAEAAVYAEALRLARLVAGEQERDLRQTEQLLAVFAEHPDVRALRPETCSLLAARLLTPVYANIGAATARGDVVCSALHIPGPVSIADRLYFRRAMTTGDMAMGEYQIGRITGRASLNFGYPIRGADGPAGVAFAALDLARLNDVAAQAALPRGTSLLVLDEHGTILARYPDPEAWVGRRSPDADLFPAMQRAGREGTALSAGSDGVRRFYGFTVLPGGGGRTYVAVGIPAGPVLAQAGRAFALSLGGLIALGAATFLVLVASANALIVEPFRSLTRAAERLASGDLEARAGAERHQMNEVRELTRAFNRMAEALQQREGERARAEQQISEQLATISALYAGAQRLTRSLDTDALAEEIARTAVTVFGIRSATLGREEPDGRLRMLARYPEEGGAPAQGPDEGAEGREAMARAVRTRAPVVLDEVAGGPAPQGGARWPPGIRSAAALPLVARDRTFGALLVAAAAPAHFTPGRLEMLQAFASQAAAALENARLFEQSEQRIARLDALRAIDLAISGSLDLRLALTVLLEQVTDKLRVDAADVLLLNPHTRELEYAAGRGFRRAAVAGTRLRLGEGPAGTAALERRTVAAEGGLPAAPAWEAVRAGEGFVAYRGVPLVAKGEVKGVLEVWHRAPLAPDPDWTAFLEALAGQAAIAVDNAALFEGLQRSNLDLSLAYDTTLEGWSRALDLRDKETEGHTRRVADLTLELARAMGVREDELVHIRRGALLHDIGKMGIPDSILLKPGPLTEEEWVVMRRHPVYAYELLAPIAYLRPAIDIPYAHHEKWDGTGYPRGLKGEQIPLAARIFAVVDVWDALTSDRPYRPAWPRDRALAHLRAEAGRHFDPAVVEVFLRLNAEPGPAAGAGSASGGA